MPGENEPTQPSSQTKLTLEQALSLAIQHHSAGDLPKARYISEQILQAHPDQPVALHLLGVIAHHKGQYDSAVDLITRALAITPEDAEANNDLGPPLRALGRLDEAVTSYQKALAIKPDLAEAHYNLGNIFRQLGKPGEAVASFKKALTFEPGNSKTHFNLGLVLRDTGKLDDAVASYRTALEIEPDYVEVHNSLGIALRYLGKPKDAIASYRKALAIKSNFAEAQNNLGNAFQDLGEIDDAVAAFRKAISGNKNYATAHYNLAISKKHTEYDEDVKAMENAHAHSDLRKEEKMYLSYGLGKAFEDLKEYEKAFEFFATGNVIKRQSCDYSHADEEACFKKIKTIFNENFYARYPQAKKVEEAPVFIVGMPRSGTTLVEQILASHPKIHGAGELPYLENVITHSYGSISNIKFTDHIQRTDSKQLSDASQDYITMLRKHSRSARFITDKMPSNYLFVGLINLMMPKAKIIHCIRDPLDTCLSIFKTFFSTRGRRYDYAYALTELGQYYNLYRDLMQHWRTVSRNVIYEIQYENVVANQEKESRALMDYCELEWDNACLEFYKTKRSVMTASATQVRRPIYKTSVQSWKRYEDQLQPLRKILC